LKRRQEPPPPHLVVKPRREAERGQWDIEGAQLYVTYRTSPRSSTARPQTRSNYAQPPEGVRTKIKTDETRHAQKPLSL
jgi:hypothetical protein